MLAGGHQAQIAELKVQTELTERAWATPPTKGVSDDEVPKKGMEAKLNEFVEKGAEVCAKA